MGREIVVVKDLQTQQANGQHDGYRRDPEVGHFDLAN
jgi:hypothetical protein